MDMGSLPPSDLFMLSEPDAAVHALLSACHAKPKQIWPTRPLLPPLPEDDVISLRALAQALAQAAEGAPLCVARLPLGWHGAYRDFTHPLDYLGADGGGGIGAGPGNAVGVALAMRDAKTDRIPVALIGDGDYLMGNTAIWTAVRYGIPVLIIVCNNHSFFNDELHQERVAKERHRPPENKWIGQRMSDPEINIAMMADAMGATALGPIRARHELQAAIAQGLNAVRLGQTCVIDINVAPGYDTNMSGQNSTQSSVHKR
jgi:thiamine pyrophosphate-dependent acetolactate synthase large subunit-like protein